MQVTTQLSEADWEIANDMASQLASQKVDHNELGKVFSYLKSVQSGSKSSERFATYLMTLATGENIAKRSQQTNSYHKSIYDAYHDYLKRYDDQPERMINVLGWVVRLIRYYKSEQMDRTHQKSKNHTKRQQNRSFYQDKKSSTVSQSTKATVRNIKKTQVTYKIDLFEIKQEEPTLSKKLKKGKTYPAKLIENPDGTRKVEITGGF